MFLAKAMPATGLGVLDFLRDDYYYAYLLPLCIPTTILGMYLNWVSMKIFRSN
jgi:hypothetical protein